MSKAIKRLSSLMLIMVMTVCMLIIDTNESFATSTKVKLSGANAPTSITLGKSYSIKGKIVSNKKMSRVEIGIVSANNKWTKYKYDNKKVNATSFNIKKADNTLKFGKLPAGKYYYRIYAHVKGEKAIVVLNKSFTVKKAVAKKSATTKKTSTSKATTVKKISTNKATTAQKTTSNKATSVKPVADKVSLSGYNCPTSYAVGSNYKIKGQIKCNNTIKRVEIGIVVTATNKWSEYKYNNSAVNAKTFDISKAAPTLKFNKLPGGKFTYRIYVHTDKGVTLALNKSFVVKPSSKPKAAIEWATKVAKNDKFTYGKGYGSHSTCCVCAGRCNAKEDAQFTCMPFLAAAYAHGTRHPALVNNGRHLMYLNDKNFKSGREDAWFKVGLCKDLKIEDLQPGDVIIKWSDDDCSGHAWMYGGGDSIIEAVPADIHVLNKGAAAKLKRYGKTEGITSKNYVMRFRG